MVKLVAGLGNPGERYAASRHNVGFEVVDLLARRHGAPEWSSRFQGHLSTLQIGAERVLLLKPRTFMNLSGASVQAACAFYRLGLDDIVVVHDDIDLELGRVLVKVGGGHGGHNGLRSIAACLGAGFHRVRLGVSRPQGHDVTGHVLGSFGAEEQGAVAEMIGRGADAVEALVSGGPTEAQNRFNRRRREEP